MSNPRLQTFDQASPYDSPWTLRRRLKGMAWRLAWALLGRTTPKPCVRWRLMLLKLFGARIEGRPFVSPSAIIHMPWNLTMEHRACLAARSEVYNLGPITLKAHCTIAQQAYLCAGTHDFEDPKLPLVVGRIIIGPHAFIGARALILPGVSIGEGGVIGAGAVVSRDTPAWMICAGNPARPIRPRHREQDEAKAGAGD